MKNLQSDLSDYVMVDNVFSPEECQLFLHKMNDCVWSSHRWYKNSKSTWHDLKDFGVTYNVEVQNMMKENIMKFARKYFKEHRDEEDYKNPGSGQFSGIRFNKYEKDEGIMPHVDHIHSLFDGKKRGIPVISFVGVFNDDYEGGEFMLCGQQVELKQGDCVIFPSVFLYPHWVNKVTEGTRHSWVMWGW